MRFMTNSFRRSTALCLAAEAGYIMIALTGSFGGNLSSNEASKKKDDGSAQSDPMLITDDPLNGWLVGLEPITLGTTNTQKPSAFLP